MKRAIANAHIAHCLQIGSKARVAFCVTVSRSQIGKIHTCIGQRRPKRLRIGCIHDDALNRIIIARRSPANNDPPQYERAKKQRKNHRAEPIFSCLPLCHTADPITLSKIYCLICSTQIKVKSRRAVGKSTSIFPSSRSISNSAALL